MVFISDFMNKLTSRPQVSNFVFRLASLGPVSPEILEDFYSGRKRQLSNCNPLVLNIRKTKIIAKFGSLEPRWYAPIK